MEIQEVHSCQHNCNDSIPQQLFNHLHLQSGDKILTNRTLKYWASQLDSAFMVKNTPIFLINVDSIDFGWRDDAQLKIILKRVCPETFLCDRFMNHFLQDPLSLAMPLIDFDPHSILYCRAVRFGASTIMCLCRIFILFAKGPFCFIVLFITCFSLASYLIFQITTQPNHFTTSTLLVLCCWWNFHLVDVDKLCIFYCPGFRNETTIVSFGIKNSMWWRI